MNTSQLSSLAATPNTTAPSSSSGASAGSSWFEAMAAAWGSALDKQADDIEAKSATLKDGGDNPSGITELTALSLKMSFLSSSSHTAISSVGTALETMARKQ